MIDNLDAHWISHTDNLREIELSDPSAPDPDSQLRLRVILVVGPPDPNALSYLVPRAVFERGYPVHVGALSADMAVLDGMLEILEVMNPDDIAVFICDDINTLNAAIDQIEPQNRALDGS